MPIQSNALKTVYKGRFAPSATGNLHLGSLVVAIACALEAQQQQGLWLLRIDNIDTQRCSQQAANHIRATVKAYFPTAPPQITYEQTDRLKQYQTALEQLMTAELVYACSCSRQQLKQFQTNLQAHSCRETSYQKSAFNVQQHTHVCLKFKNPDNSTGDIHQDLTLYRRDRCFAYHLACVVDDHFDQITHIIRGADLIPAEQPQGQLIKALRYNKPHYDYIPLVKNQSGQKLSKQNHAEPIQIEQHHHYLQRALQCLIWPSPLINVIDELDTNKLWQWAQANWDLALNRILPTLLHQPEQTTKSTITHT